MIEMEIADLYLEVAVYWEKFNGRFASNANYAGLLWTIVTLKAEGSVFYGLMSRRDSFAEKTVRKFWILISHL